MALRPGSCLLISSHFIPLPRRSMINVSSSGDHFDCFFAGGSWACDDDESRFVPATAGSEGAARDMVGTGAAIAIAGAAIVEAIIDGWDIREDDDGERCTELDGASSSSSGFKRSEISTLAEDMG